MDIMSIVAFLTGSSLVASLVMSFLKKALTWIPARYGALATQLVLFGVSLLISLALSASALIPASYLVIAGAVFAGAVTIYEVLYKAVYQQTMKGQV